LRAAREGTLVAGLPVDLADRLAPLDEVLDTYSDLLVADSVYALVTGHADLANAAMEAAAGLGAPPDLRAIRTPRQATTVRVSAWALLPAAAVAADADADPARVADPAYAAALDAELGADAIDATDDAGRAKRDRFAAVLGGAENEPLTPTLTGGDYEGLPASADTDLRTAIATDLKARLVQMVALTQAAHDALTALDPGDAGTDVAIDAAATRWTVDLSGLAPADPALAAPTTAEQLTAIIAALADRLNAFVYQNNGKDLTVRSGTLLAVFVVDEEVASRGARAFVAEKPKIDLCIVGEPTSNTVVTCAAVSSECRMCRAITLRMVLNW
jgi:hypothetical protein